MRTPLEPGDLAKIDEFTSHIERDYGRGILLNYEVATKMIATRIWNVFRRDDSFDDLAVVRFYRWTRTPDLPPDMTALVDDPAVPHWMMLTGTCGMIYDWTRRYQSTIGRGAINPANTGSSNLARICWQRCRRRPSPNSAWKPARPFPQPFRIRSGPRLTPAESTLLRRSNIRCCRIRSLSCIYVGSKVCWALAHAFPPALRMSCWPIRVCRYPGQPPRFSTIWNRLSRALEPFITRFLTPYDQRPVLWSKLL